MKKYPRILVLLLALTLGTSAACSSAEPNSKNNNDSEQLADTDTSEKDVENTDDKDVENTDDKDVDDKDVENTDDKDVENTDDKDVENTDDKDVDDKDVDDKDTDLPPDPEEDKTPLKDLTDEQVIELCAVDAGKINDFFNPTKDTGIAYCLLYAAYAAYDESKDPAEMSEACEATMASCTGDSGSNDAGKCINQNGCKATVADFERCSNDNIAAFAAQTNALIGKTCSDFTTEQSLQTLNDSLDAYDYPQSCLDLNNKCPKIYDL